MLNGLAKACPTDCISIRAETPLLTPRLIPRESMTAWTTSSLWLMSGSRCLTRSAVSNVGPIRAAIAADVSISSSQNWERSTWRKYWKTVSATSFSRTFSAATRPEDCWASRRSRKCRQQHGLRWLVSGMAQRRTAHRYCGRNSSNLGRAALAATGSRNPFWSRIIAKRRSPLGRSIDSSDGLSVSNCRFSR